MTERHRDPIGGALDDGQLLELRGALVRGVAGVCPAWLADRREDIVQNALIRVVKTLQADEEKRIYADSYLWKVAFTETAKEIRRCRRRREESMELARVETEERGQSPERAVASREIGAAIVDCLKSMIESRRRPVLMHLYGYGLSETARLLARDRKRVDNLLYRGMADLRRCLESKGVRP